MKNERINLEKMSGLLGSHKNNYNNYSKEEIEIEIEDYTNLKERAIRENDLVSLAEIKEELATLHSIQG